MREAEKNAVALLIVGAIVGLVSISPIVGADGAEIYYIILRESVIQPEIANIEQNQSVRWINADNSTNATHRIIIDMDGDGTFNGTNDIDSGEIHYECETNSTDDCIVMFTVTFNNSVMGGDVETCTSVGCTSENVYGYVDEVYYEDGNVTTRQGAIVVRQHAETTIAEEETESDDTLLMIAIASGLGAVMIGSSLTNKGKR